MSSRSPGPVPESRTIVMIGATSGIGQHAARQLAAQGHRLFLCGRDTSRGQALVSSLDGRGRVRPVFIAGDVSTRDGVEAVARKVTSLTDRVDTLMNNAGVMLSHRKLTPEGIETNFAVHHLAPWSMTQQLLPLLRRGDGRIVNTNSEGHRVAVFHPGPVDLDFDDLQCERHYSTFLAYGRSKLANLLFGYEFHRRFGSEHVLVAVHPGMVRTRLVRSVRNPALRLLTASTRLFLLPPRQGGKPLAHLATAADVVGGRYYDRFTPTRSSSQSTDIGTARRLWEVTERLRGPMEPR